MFIFSLSYIDLAIVNEEFEKFCEYYEVGHLEISKMDYT